MYYQLKLFDIVVNDYNNFIILFLLFLTVLMHVNQFSKGLTKNLVTF